MSISAAAISACSCGSSVSPLAAKIASSSVGGSHRTRRGPYSVFQDLLMVPLFLLPLTFAAFNQTVLRCTIIMVQRTIRKPSVSTQGGQRRPTRAMRRGGTPLYSALFVSARRRPQRGKRALYPCRVARLAEFHVILIRPQCGAVCIPAGLEPQRAGATS